jgi:DNA-binding NtrC family response regulator
VTIRVPPLRERAEDIQLLATHFVRSCAERHSMPSPELSPRALEELVAFGWPGNVRELRNVVDRAVALSPGAQGFAALRVAIVEEPRGDGALAVRSDLPWAEARQRVVEAFERAYLREVIDRAGGNLSAAARESGLDRKHLRALARKHGIAGGEG